ncbi:MAG TPA: hypothetical protein VJ499_03485 [Flavisolibacter sp.]|nr:hypothetical protein [Flavisolibacter sp.]
MYPRIDPVLYLFASGDSAGILRGKNEDSAGMQYSSMEVASN